jgi:hypothetical protein
VTGEAPACAAGRATGQATAIDTATAAAPSTLEVTSRN